MRAMLNTVLMLVGFFVEASAATTYTACKDGWLPYQGNCYLFGHKLMQFSDAEKFCSQHEARVAEMPHLWENAFIKEHLREMKPQCYWLGLTDRSVEGVWRWYNSDTPTTYTDWAPNEPENLGDCTVLYPLYDFKWGDFLCTNNCGPLCKSRGITESSHIVG